MAIGWTLCAEELSKEAMGNGNVLVLGATVEDHDALVVLRTEPFCKSRSEVLHGGGVDIRAIKGFAWFLDVNTRSESNIMAFKATL
jgi:hypothetical protein